jgi:cyclase
MPHDRAFFQHAVFIIYRLARLSEHLTIPIIASGGAGSAEDIAAVLSDGRADAALAASIFHYGEMTVGELKGRLREMNINVRL